MIHFIIIIIAAFIATFVVLALISKKEFTISSDIIIDRSVAEVFLFIRLIRNQEKYSKWVMQDPDVKLTYTGTDGEVGFISKWSSDMRNVGAGEQEITEVHEGKGYEVAIRFEKPVKGTSFAQMTTEDIGDNKTRVTNSFDSSTPFPMNIMSPMIKRMLKNDIDETLANLKRVLEK